MHINYWTELKRNKFGRIGLIMVSILVLVALAAPFLAPHNPWVYQGQPLTPPSEEYILGLNDIGQDILSELIYGTRTTLLVGVSVAVFSTLISLALALAAALGGRIVDRIILRLIDIMLILPVFLIAILVAIYFKPGVVTIIIMLTLLLWPPGARILRAQTLSLKERQHLTAASSFGAGKGYIVYRHLIPDLYPLLTVNLIQMVRRTVFMEAGLAFLGIFDPTQKSWGLMIHYASEFIFTGAWKWWLLPPGLLISYTIIGFALIGYALESSLDPRLRRNIHYVGH